MAQKMIRLDDDVYTELSEMAPMESRSIANLASHLLRKTLAEALADKDGKLVSPASGERYLKTDEVSSLIKPDIKKSEATPLPNIRPFNQADPLDATNPEKACCKNEDKPCTHWVWDTSTGEGYRNTLSGRYREAM